MNRGQQPVDARSRTASATRPNRRTATSRGYAGIRKRLSTLAFWSAIALPAFYLPLLVDGIETIDQLWLFVGLVGLHVLALVGGRRRHVEPS